MSKLTSIIQAILLTTSLIFIIIFIYLFITNANLIIPGHQQSVLSDKRSTPKDTSHHHQHAHESDFKVTTPTSERPDAKGDANSIDASKRPDEVIIDTKYGPIKGFNQRVFDTNVNTFLGVPYAAPPVGPLRFKRTAPITAKVSQTMDCTRLKPKCVQLVLDKVSFTDVSPGMSEDCLYLNIWAPARADRTKRDADEEEDDYPDEADAKEAKEEDDDKLKPVMIWIYGGGFFMGSSNYDETDGRVLAAVGDVIVITFEYRVGAFGFIDLGTDNESGNQGAFDELAVIKWAKDNVQFFGGNPDKMTLFGESSGAISIGLHLMSPESSGLINSVIMQSGSPMMTNAFFTRAEKSIPEFVRELKCSDSDSIDANYNINCLRKKSVLELLNATRAMHDKYFFAFPPNVDDLFLSAVPTEVIKSEDKAAIFKNVKNVLIGNNLNSFSYMLWLANRDAFPKDAVSVSIDSVEDVKLIMRDKIGHLLQMPTFQISFLTGKLFANLSDAKSSARNPYLDKMIEVLGDVSFVCPSKIIADEMAALGKNVHSYVFTHALTRTKDKWGDWFGVTLHDEIPLVFGHPLRNPLKYSGKDIEMSKRMMRTWAHFARTGQVLDQLGNEWPKYTKNERVFMELNSEVASVGSNYHEETCQTFKLGFDLLN